MQDTYDKETAEFIATICRSIPHLTGDVMRGWIENPAALKSALRRVLCSPQTINPAQPPPREFAIWKRIKLGTHKDAAGLKRDLENGGITLSEWAADIFLWRLLSVSNRLRARGPAQIECGRLRACRFRPHKIMAACCLPGASEHEGGS